jgi:RNA polymerase sigma-70 factor (ECF subfamily)
MVETNAEDITIETFSKAFDKIALTIQNFNLIIRLISIAKKCVHIDSLPQKFSLFVEITDKEDQKAYNIADTTPTAEDELITEQNLSQLLQFIKELKPHYQEVIQLRYFQEMISPRNSQTAIDEPLSNNKVKLLRAKNY